MSLACFGVALSFLGLYCRNHSDDYDLLQSAAVVWQKIIYNCPIDIRDLLPISGEVLKSG